MTTRRILLAVLLALCAAPVRATEIPDETKASPELLDTIRANRKALLAVNLGLTPDEATKFWPVYDQYQAELAPVQDRIAAIVDEYMQEYRGLGDDKALDLMNRFLAAEEERAKIRRAYAPQFAEVVPGRKVARFYQIENKMDAVLRYELASRIPVVEEKGGAAR